MFETLGMDGMRPEIWIAGLVGAAATVEDLLRRTISNWLPVAALLGGIGCHVAARGWSGLGTAALGAAGGFGVFLVFYLLGGMGGGDVKLMAGFGAILGIGRLVPAAVLAAIFGGLLAAAVLGYSALRRRLRTVPGEAAASAATPATIPYAPAIVLGVWLTLFAGI